MATTGKLNGTLYKITVGGVAISNLTENSASFKIDTRETTTKDSSGNKEFLATLKSAEYSGSAIVALDATFGVEDLYDDLVLGAAVAVVFTTGVAGDVQWTQQGIITSVDISAPMEDNVTVSFSVMGTGAVTKADVGGS